MIFCHRIERDDCEDRHGEGDEGHHWEKNPPAQGKTIVIRWKTLPSLRRALSYLSICTTIIIPFIITIQLCIIIIHNNDTKSAPSEGISCSLCEEASKLGRNKSQASHKWWSLPGNHHRDHSDNNKSVCLLIYRPPYIIEEHHPVPWHPYKKGTMCQRWTNVPATNHKSNRKGPSPKKVEGEKNYISSSQHRSDIPLGLSGGRSGLGKKNISAQQYQSRPVFLLGLKGPSK